MKNGTFYVKLMWTLFGQLWEKIGLLFTLTSGHSDRKVAKDKEEETQGEAERERERDRDREQMRLCIELSGKRDLCWAELRWPTKLKKLTL